MLTTQSVLDIRWWCAAVTDSVIKTIVRAVPWPSGFSPPLPLLLLLHHRHRPLRLIYRGYTTVHAQYARATCSLSLCLSSPSTVTARANSFLHLPCAVRAHLLNKRPPPEHEHYSPRRVYSRWIISVRDYCNPHSHTLTHSRTISSTPPPPLESLIYNNNTVDTHLIINRATITLVNDTCGVRVSAVRLVQCVGK